MAPIGFSGNVYTNHFNAILQGRLDHFPIIFVISLYVIPPPLPLQLAYELRLFPLNIAILLIQPSNITK